MLVALATLHALQTPGRAKSKFADAIERDYVESTDRCLRRICGQAGLPEDYLHEIIRQARRETMRLVKTQ